MSLSVVTGASGHLGNVLVRELRNQGEDVRVIIQPGDGAEALAGLSVQRIAADINDTASLVGAFRGAQRVFHLAGIVSISRAQRSLMHAVNVGGTASVLRACRDAGVGRLIHMGSVHALTEPKAGILDESAGYDAAKASGAYGKTKAEACALIEAAAKRGEIDAVIVLPTGVVVPFDTRVSEVGQLLTDLEHGRVPFLLPGGHDWVDVRDVATGTWQAATLGKSGRSYLLGGEYVSLTDIATVVSEVTGCRIPAVLPAWVARAVAMPAPLFESLTGRRALLTPYAVHALTVPFRVSHARAASELGYAPRALRTSFREAIEWRHALTSAQLTPGPGRHFASWAQ